MNLRNLCSLEECARTLNNVVSPQRLREFCDSGHLPHVRIDGEPFVRAEKVDTWVNRNLLGADCKGAPLPGRERPLTPRGPRNLPYDLQPMAKWLQRIELVEYPPGVYFLVQGDAVIYVGQSVTPLLRVADHRKRREFESAFYVPVPIERLNQVEGAFIRHFRPPLNRGAPAGLGTDDAVLEEFGLMTHLLEAHTEGTPPQAAPKAFQEG